ncbi:MAG: hypothetical protein H0Z28_10480 [Archaeoglobus sp.]|nr:hypothetical protein [Archaeoglobus sp.]
MPVDYDLLLEELKKEAGPLAKIFLDKAMDALELKDLNDTNYKDVLGILKMNPTLRKYVEVVEKRLNGL